MALTSAQLKAIQAQARRNIATRAAIQAKKISPQEARVAAAGMKRGEVPTYRGVYQDKPLLTRSEAAANAKSNKENAAKEAARQKQRKFAKGEGKLPIKQRVGTKAEYKALGKEIELRRDLIAAAKKAKAAQAARRANPAPAKTATPAKAATPTKSTPAKKTTAKKSTPAKKTAAKKPMAPKMGKADIAKFESNVDKLVAEQKATKPSTAAIKKRTVPNTKAATPTEPKLKTLDEAKASAPKPKGTQTTKLQTLDDAKSKAPTPKGTGSKAPTAAEFKDTMAKAPSNAPLKPKGKVAGVTGAAKKAVGSTKTVKTIKAASQTTAAKKVAASKPAKLLKSAGKVAKIGLRIGQVVGAAKEVGQVVSGQAEKDFRRIQALENRIAVAKGQKPKYTSTGSNKNLLSSVKTDLGNAANILSVGMVGKTRKDRLQELKALAQKAEKKAATMPKPPAGKSTTGGKGGGKPSVSTPPPAKITGNKYRVTTGDTLSGIAARSGVSLKELRAANPQITDPRKIYRNTGVVIPKGGKVPTGGYSKKVK